MYYLKPYIGFCMHRKNTPTIENDWRTTELHKFSRLNRGDHALIGAGVRRSKTAVKRR